MNHPQRYWDWTSGRADDAQRAATGRNPLSFADAGQANNSAGSNSAGDSGLDQEPRQRHYKPRTCRICLDVVEPTTEINESITKFFTSRARVRYVSDDPKLGRLISPCKCKGSQRYVHEGCLQAWRKSQPLSDRNYWHCPTCNFEYRMARLRWGRWITSKIARAILTLLICLLTVFILGFVADPIFSIAFEPVSVLSERMGGSVMGTREVDPEESTWYFHFVKGFISLGLLGAIKALFTMPWRWLIRVNGGVRRRGADRFADINSGLVLVGVAMFMMTTWKVVERISITALANFSESIVEVGGDDLDEDDEDSPAQESRKDI
ncbi:hypothetical protein QBC46DRAFT_335850 [Diplogelasinospora grovesii]|uniref:RING-CH-type domain-containing protein n=1 Tax=Diplogelasinospora grovesii TaxID=303347 RepID=A0AAN6NJT4_9PEZI|nr:hypothetical protein QBC46DRAFT_335850 [Diplogelasinospora grovesii]